jgi:hypothetical protein
VLLPGLLDYLALMEVDYKNDAVGVFVFAPGFSIIFLFTAFFIAKKKKIEKFFTEMSKFLRDDEARLFILEANELAKKFYFSKMIIYITIPIFGGILPLIGKFAIPIWPVEFWMEGGAFYVMYAYQVPMIIFCTALIMNVLDLNTLMLILTHGYLKYCKHIFITIGMGNLRRCVRIHRRLLRYCMQSIIDDDNLREITIFIAFHRVMRQFNDIYALALVLYGLLCICYLCSCVFLLLRFVRLISFNISSNLTTSRLFLKLYRILQCQILDY